MITERTMPYANQITHSHIPNISRDAVVKLSIKSNQIKSNLDLIEIDTKLKFPPPPPTTTTHPKLLKSYKSAITRWILMKLSQKLLKDVLSNLTPSPGSSRMLMSS